MELSLFFPEQTTQILETLVCRLKLNNFLTVTRKRGFILIHLAGDVNILVQNLKLTFHMVHSLYR